jgi:hypothetical protein
MQISIGQASWLYYRLASAPCRSRGGHSRSQAYYAPGSDHIQLPVLESLCDAHSFVAVRAYEAEHWTAPAHRANRDLSCYHKDRSERSRKELVAELGTVTLSADLVIVPKLEPRPDLASYLSNWLNILFKRLPNASSHHARLAPNTPINETKLLCRAPVSLSYQLEYKPHRTKKVYFSRPPCVRTPASAC